MTIRRDAYYTPAEVATSLVSYVPQMRIATVADFAAGEGALLSAARTRWPNARLIAADVSHDAIAAVRATLRPATSIVADFLDQNEKRVSAKYVGKCDLVLLNPPFSCRGSHLSAVSVAGREFRCAPALAFVLRSTEYLNRGGVIASVLPRSALTREKDSDAVTYLYSNFEISIHQTLDRCTFDGCRAAALIATFRAGSRTAASHATITVREYELVRGSIQMFKAEALLDKKGLPLIHTTNMRMGEICSATMFVSSNRPFTGPAVLLPRVGRITKGKIVLLKGRSPVALSDCVFAIKCPSQQHASKIRQALCQRIEHIEAKSQATGAPYLTLNNVRELLLTCCRDNNPTKRPNAQSHPIHEPSLVMTRSAPSARD